MWGVKSITMDDAKRAAVDALIASGFTADNDGLSWLASEVGRRSKPQHAVQADGLSRASREMLGSEAVEIEEILKGLRREEKAERVAMVEEQRREEEREAARVVAEKAAWNEKRRIMAEEAARKAAEVEAQRILMERVEEEEAAAKAVKMRAERDAMAKRAAERKGVLVTKGSVYSQPHRYVTGGM